MHGTGFVVLTRRFEQLAFVQRSLDGFAIRLGSTRISLLDLLSALFAGVVLYAVVRLAIQGAKALIRRRADFDLTQSLLAEKLAEGEARRRLVDLERFGVEAQRRLDLPAGLVG